MPNHTEAVIRNRISICHQNELAEQVGLSKSQVGRIVAGENGVKLDQLELFLLALGLRVVTTEQVVISQQEYDALRLFAAQALVPKESR